MGWGRGGHPKRTEKKDAIQARIWSRITKSRGNPESGGCKSGGDGSGGGGGMGGGGAPEGGGDGALSSKMSEGEGEGEFVALG